MFLLRALLMLALGSGTATLATADTGLPGTVAPAIEVSGQVEGPATGLRLAPADATDMARLDARGLLGTGVFAADGGRAMFSRARFLGFAPWGTALTLEMSRPATSRRGWGTLGWRAGARLRLLASKPMANGALVLGLGAGIDQRRMRGFLPGTDRAYSSRRSIEFGWVSEDRWRLTLGYQTTTGGSGRRSGNRLMDIASGAPLHEQGPRLTLAFADRTRPVAYGLIAGAATVSDRDAKLIGRAHATQDGRASLFWITRF